MASNKTFLWIAASLITGVLCAFSAMAEVQKPEAYERLTSVQLQPGNAPRSLHGLEDLSAHEQKHREHLPLQLDGAMKKVKKAKYRPQKASAHARKAKHSALKVKHAKAHQDSSFREELSLPQDVKQISGKAPREEQQRHRRPNRS